MKQFILVLVTTLVSSHMLTAQNDIKIDTVDTSMEDISYSLGVLMATNIKAQNIENLDIQALTKGMTDILLELQPKYSPEECNQIFSTYMTAKQAFEFEEIKLRGDEFLVENANRPEVTVTESGLQYEVLKDTIGPKPASTDRVTVHYTGTLLDGTVFDSSVERGEPATFNVGQLIQGWTEGLQLMSVGSKYKMYIPYDLAYGSRGAGNRIPPYSVIVFEVELLGIE